MADSWAAIRADGDRARRTVEAERIRLAFEAHGWSLAQTALALEVDAETLSRYLARRHPDLCAERRRMAKCRR